MTDLTVFITRPAERGEALAKALEMDGHKVVVQPMVRIVPYVPFDASDEGAELRPQVLQTPLPSDQSVLLLFTSVYAVEYFFSEAQTSVHEAIKQIPPSQVCYLAIGPATQDALATYNIDAKVAPEHNSESAINLLTAYQAEFGMALGSVLLIKGAGGRTLMSEWLAANQIPYQEWIVYRREAIQTLSPSTIDAYGKLEAPPLMVFTSVEAMDLWAQWCKRYGWSLAPAIVCSERMVERAAQLGMIVKARALGCDNDALLEAIRGVS